MGRLTQLQSKAPLGASLVVLSSVFYASYGIWATHMGDFFGSFTSGALRCILVVVLLSLLAWPRKELQRIHLRRDAKWFAIMILASALTGGPLYYSILNAGVGLSIGLGYVGIVIGMFFFGWMFSGERFTRDKFVATALGFLGLALVFLPSVGSFGWLSLTAALVSGLEYGGG